MITAPLGTPPWLAAFAAQINRALGQSPTAPTPVYAVNAAADLVRLPPQDHTERLVFVRDIARLAVSTGTQWLRQDTGAQISP